MEYKSRNLHGSRKYNFEHFSCWQHLPNLHGIWINHKILGNLIWLNLWSDRLFAHLITNAPESYIGQKVFVGDLQGLDYDLGNMNTPTLKIEEDIKFQCWLIIKLLSWKKFRLWELNYIALFGLWIKYLLTSTIFVYLHTCRTSGGEQILF
jgi:hypothetical protein